MSTSRRRFEGSELIVASHNAGKISEIGELLAPFGVASIGADALGLDEPEETGADFIANAELKARAAALTTGRPALADDCGLAVDALDGRAGNLFGTMAQTPDGTRDFNSPCARSKRHFPFKTRRATHGTVYLCVEPRLARRSC